MWKGIYTSMANCRFLQVLLLHLGTYKWMCSLMRKVSLHVHLPCWKTIKFPLIWYIIYWFSLKSFLKNLNLKKCLLSFFCWVYYDPIYNSHFIMIATSLVSLDPFTLKFRSSSDITNSSVSIATCTMYTHVPVYWVWFVCMMTFTLSLTTHTCIHV